MKKTLIFALTIMATGALQAQATLELSQMSDSDKNKTGIYKLSETELKSLENWLNQKQKQITSVEKQNNAGFESKQVESSRETIQVTLDKMYKDILGNTFYQLTNGQVWKQVQSGSVNINKEGNQMITIEPKMMGSWLLKGEGNRGVKVKRIR